MNENLDRKTVMKYASMPTFVGVIEDISNHASTSSNFRKPFFLFKNSDWNLSQAMNSVAGFEEKNNITDEINWMLLYHTFTIQ